ncbi:MAG: HAD family phosphatase [Geminocystis sp.]|nr:HAD family phosphatase [Geminocystis sp.]HIK36377.1 HAD family phosphatase [Geminocystis sp. M7585_C2015_104]MCS7147972.1 HAD family phosphatase [Geminocystis sp.]MCX8078946.1 HAD family phosphatase [Geminocystis sp.]MDW8116948.1 HAD family phosphatase [Geminocystis sp.]
MSIKAVLFDFNGIIIKDEEIHQQLIDELLLEENLQPSRPGEYQRYCLGRNDYSAIKNILEARGRFVQNEYLDKLVKKKGKLYLQILSTMETIPIFEGVREFIQSLQTRNLPLAIVSGALRQDIEYVLEKTNLKQHFPVVVAGDEIKASKPSPEAYLLALTKLNQISPLLDIKPQHCLVIEDTLVGIASGKNAGMTVVAVANTYPLHILQRHANWCVDRLSQIDLDWINQVLAKKTTESAIMEQQME